MYNIIYKYKSVLWTRFYFDTAPDPFHGKLIRIRPKIEKHIYFFLYLLFFFHAILLFYFTPTAGVSEDPPRNLLEIITKKDAF